MSAFLIQYHGEVVSVKRYSQGTYEDGVYVPGAEQTISIVAGIMPATPDEIKILTAGMETTAAITIYSTDELKTGSKTAKTNPDIVLWNGQEWQVQGVEAYRQTASSPSLYRSIAVLID
jgi:hypothetical protein